MPSSLMLFSLLILSSIHLLTAGVSGGVTKYPALARSSEEGVERVGVVMSMAPIPFVPSSFVATTEAGVAGVEQLLLPLLLVECASRISTYSYKCLVALDLEDDECVLRWNETPSPSSRDTKEDSIDPSDALSHTLDVLSLLSSLTRKPTTLFSALTPQKDLTTVLEVLDDPIDVVAVLLLPLLLLLLEEVRGFAEVVRVAVASGGGATPFDLETEIVHAVATEEMQLGIREICEFGKRGKPLNDEERPRHESRDSTSSPDNM